MATVTSLLGVAWRSLLYRFGGVLLTIVSVAISVFVLLGVEHVRQEARNGFASTVSGVDLIVGARTGEVNLLLLSVFRIGTATANVSQASLEQIEAQQNVAWTVPISLGDSHRGYRVIGTTQAFFTRYKYANRQALAFREGAQFDGLTDIVLGSRVAAELSYQLGDSIVLSHGVADVSFTHHDELPLTVRGILAPTGTPIDNALFVNLAAIDALHEDASDRNVDSNGESERGAHDDHEAHGNHEAHEDHDAHDNHEAHDHHESHDDHEAHDDHEVHDAHDDHDSHDEPHQGSEHEESGPADEGHDHEHPATGAVTAVLVGLDSPIATLQVKRWADNYPDEALLAILPGVALTQLWELVGNVEAVLLGISILVFASSLLGLNAMLLASMRERRGEIEVLRSIGAPSFYIVGLLLLESLLIVTSGIVFAVLGLLLCIAVANAFLVESLGLMLSSQIFSSANLLALFLIYLTTLVVTVFPALQAYRVSKSVGGGSLDS